MLNVVRATPPPALLCHYHCYYHDMRVRVAPVSFSFYPSVCSFAVRSFVFLLVRSYTSTAQNGTTVPSFSVRAVALSSGAE